MATNSLPKLTEFRPISVSAVHVLARLAARRAVQDELRVAGGNRIVISQQGSTISPADNGGASTPLTTSKPHSASPSAPRE